MPSYSSVTLLAWCAALVAAPPAVTARPSCASNAAYSAFANSAVKSFAISFCSSHLHLPVGTSRTHDLHYGLDRVRCHYQHADANADDGDVSGWIRDATPQLWSREDHRTSPTVVSVAGAKRASSSSTGVSPLAVLLAAPPSPAVSSASSCIRSDITLSSTTGTSTSLFTATTAATQ